jgi:hypothetical protein
MRSYFNIAPYCAGYLEGDGCFYIGTYLQSSTQTTVFEFSVQVVSTKRDVLVLFREKFGGSIGVKPHQPRRKVQHCWIIKNNECLALACVVLPYLIEKGRICALFMEYGKSIKPNMFKTISNKILLKRNKLIKQIRKMRNMDNLITKEAVEALKESSSTVQPSEENFAYLAGLIDAEGCFRIKKWKPKNKPNYVYAITLEIGNTKFPIFPWLVDRFGGSVCYIRANSRRKKDSAIWSLSAKQLVEILPTIYPYLRCKKLVCEKLMEFNKTILPNGGDRNSEEFRNLYSETIAIREKIVCQIHLLNCKGVKF